MDKVEMQAHRRDGLPFRVSLEAVNKGVGVVAFGLPVALLVVSWLGGTCPGIDSISHYYYSRIGGDILVGALCFIGALMLFFYKLPDGRSGTMGKVDGYLGHRWWDIWLARLAGLCAFGVAFAPTDGEGCEDYGGGVSRLFLTETTGGHSADPRDIAGTASFDFWGTWGVEDGVLTMIHYGSAAIMFGVLAYFSLVVFTRRQSATSVEADDDSKPAKRNRNAAYVVCGLLILLAIAGLGYKFLAYDEGTPGLAWWNRHNLTFWFESLGLVAFGVSWSLKGRLFAIFRDPQEHSPKAVARVAPPPGGQGAAA